MINLEQLKLGVINYIEKEIAQKAVGVQKFGVYFFLPQISKKIEDLFIKNKDNPMLSDFIINDEIDLDALYNSAKGAIRKTGQIQMYGIIFNESDVDKLYNYIKNTLN